MPQISRCIEEYRWKGKDENPLHILPKVYDDDEVVQLTSFVEIF